MRQPQKQSLRPSTEYVAVPFLLQKHMDGKANQQQIELKCHDDDANSDRFFCMCKAIVHSFLWRELVSTITLSLDEMDGGKCKSSEKHLNKTDGRPFRNHSIKLELVGPNELSRTPVVGPYLTIYISLKVRISARAPLINSSHLLLRWIGLSAHISKRQQFLHTIVQQQREQHWLVIAI